MKRALLLIVAAGGLAGGGCGSDQLETGYAFTPLGDSSSRRRGYYADPFSPEAQKSQVEQQTQTNNRRQVPGR